MNIVIRPIGNAPQELDITHALVAAIAHELWRAGGGNAEVNWLEAERHLAAIAGLAPAEVEAAGAGRRTILDSATPRERSQEPVACPGCPRGRRGARNDAATPLTAMSRHSAPRAPALVG